MAKVTFGPIVSEARNKVGGVVFSRNPHGAYSRTWLVPHNPNTTAQAAARLSMRELSQRWASTLNDEQRAAWRSLGKLYPHIDVFRQKSIRPGLQTYLRSNLALASVGSPPLDDAPRKLSASDPAGVTATAVSGSPPVITVNSDSAPAINEAVQIWVSPGLSTGRSYFYKYMRLVQTFTAGTAGPWDPSAGWAARFTTLAFPSKLGIGVRYVNVETGATGPMRTAFITATEVTDIMLAVQVAITDADFKNLPSAPIELLPAPAAGKMYALFQAILIFNAGATPYAAADVDSHLGVGYSGNFYLGPVLNDSTDGIGQLSAWLLSLTYQKTLVQWLGTSADQEATHAVGVLKATQAVQLLTDNSINFTGGDPANTCLVTLFYAIIDAP